MGKPHSVNNGYSLQGSTLATVKEEESSQRIKAQYERSSASIRLCCAMHSLSTGSCKEHKSPTSALHTFPDGDVASSLQIPVPTLELDFRISINLDTKVSVGQSIRSGREWGSYAGGYLVAAGDDETIQVFDIKQSKNLKSVPSKKYGVHLARFTYHSLQVVHAGTQVDHSLRLLDLQNERYVRYFSGHTDKVTCLAVSPGSKDETVALWDLSSRNPQSRLKLATPYLVTFDPSASVIAIASQSTSSILLYDFRNYGKAPFSTFDLAPFEELYTPSILALLYGRAEAEGYTLEPDPSPTA
ncbi:hypothetical protein N7476_005067 [Penicillium atrosanguineum]|uniref:Uncharacterized protein n=1 Tax=Penicillium atrosanguineum TaxID=1132637 RepID=A0A9W9PZ70_9EURO|nr:hypothetical protein N7476_005067 [Penicillium atrosanguineum]